MKRILVVGIFILSAAVVHAEQSTLQAIGQAAGEAAVQAAVQTVAAPLFTEQDRRAIHEFYRITDRDRDNDKHSKKNKHGKDDKGGKDMPPGLAKKDQLPPGLAKQLQKNGTLPPGLAKRNLPHDLDRRLSRMPAGFGRVVVDRDVAIVNEKTGLIIDIIHDVVVGSGTR